MDEKDKGKIIEYKPKKDDNPINDPYIYEEDVIDDYQEIMLPDDFIYTPENLNVMRTIYGFYKIIGLNDEDASDATCMFVDMFGDSIGLVPKITEE